MRHTNAAILLDEVIIAGLYGNKTDINIRCNFPKLSEVTNLEDILIKKFQIENDDSKKEK